MDLRLAKMRPSTQNIEENITDRPHMSFSRKYRPTLKKREVRLILEKVSHDKFFCQGSIQIFMNFKRVVFLSSFSSKNYFYSIYEVKIKSYWTCLT